MRAILCSATPLKTSGTSSFGHPNLSEFHVSVTTFEFFELVFDSTLTLASFTGFHPFEWDSHRQHTNLRPMILVLCIGSRDRGRSRDSPPAFFRPPIDH